MFTKDIDSCVSISGKYKRFVSPTYNYIFNMENGFLLRWGASKDDDPQIAPGPEIMDLEISVNGCQGVGVTKDGGKGPSPCAFCYKSNTSGPPTNMSFETFKAIFDKMPKMLTQIAFGITGVQTNPDFLKMMQYSRANNVIPNFTLTGIDLTDALLDEFSKVVGAVAVSCYSSNKNLCYDTIKKFTDSGVTQTNMHVMVSKETLDFTKEVIEDIGGTQKEVGANSGADSRLQKLNAVVFLGLKPKGRAKGVFNVIDESDFANLVKVCMEKKLKFGFDSCSAPKFERAIKGMEREKELTQMSEPCESSLFSTYINVAGECWNCSFSEDEEGVEPVNVLEAEDFIRDVWHSSQVEKFRKRLLGNERRCPIFKIDK